MPYIMLHMHIRHILPIVHKQLLPIPIPMRNKLPIPIIPIYNIPNMPSMHTSMFIMFILVIV